MNFSLLFTFVTFFYFLYEYLEQYHDKYHELHPWIVGIASAITGLLLMKTSIHYGNGVIVDTRNVMILIAGLVGGPISIAVSAILIGLFRIFLAGISTTSIIAGANTIFLGFILSLFSQWKPITFRNMHYYLSYMIVQVCIGYAITSKDLESRLLGISAFIIVNVTAFYATIFVLGLFRKQFERIRFIRKLAETDYLTDLPNSRKFKSIIDQHIENNDEFTLLLVDIDHFRSVNTTYGHVVGDEILKQIGQHLKKFVQEHEGTNTARVSGEEFYVICKHAAPAFGLHYAYEISKHIAKNPFIVSDGRKIPITVSIGIANYPDNGKNIRELFTATNRALMQAVSKGTSQIIHFNHIHL